MTRKTKQGAPKVTARDVLAVLQEFYRSNNTCIIKDPCETCCAAIAHELRKRVRKSSVKKGRQS